MTVNPIEKTKESTVDISVAVTFEHSADMDDSLIYEQAKDRLEYGEYTIEHVRVIHQSL